MIKRLAWAALAATVSVAATPALAQAEYEDCSYWEAGAQIPRNTPVVIRQVVFVDVTKRVRGSTFIAGAAMAGKFKFDTTTYVPHPTSPDDVPSTPLAIFHSEKGRTGFVLSRNGGARFFGEDGVNEPAISGKLGPKVRFLDTVEFPAIECVRIKGLPLMSAAQAVAQGYTLKGEPRVGEVIIIDGDAIPGDDRGDLSDIFAADGTVREASPDPGGLADAMARTDPGDGEVGLRDIMPTPSKDAGDDLSDLGDDVARTDPAPTLDVPEEQRVCPLNALDPVLAGNVFADAPLVVAGRLATDAAVPGYVFNEVVREFFGAETQVSAPYRAGDLISVHLPFGARTVETTEGDKIIPAEIPGELSAVGDVAKPDDTEKLRLVIISDSAALAASGLDALERRVVKRLGAAYWLTEWYEILPDGSVTARGLFATMARAVAAAKETETQSVLSRAEQIEILAGSIETLLRDAPQTVDQVFWIMEGFQLPAQTPAILEIMLGNVAASGNVRRESDGLIKPWLQVIAGQFNPAYSAAYLQGPVSTSYPPAGAVSIQDPRESGERERILTNLDVPASLLERLVTERAREADRDIAPIATLEDSLMVNANDLFADMGVIIDSAELSRLLADIAATRKVFRNLARGEAADTILVKDGTLDLGALLDPKTNDDGTLRAALLDPNGVKRRLALLGLTADSPYVLQHLDDIEDLLSDISAVADVTGCDRYYVTSDEFGANWVFTP